METLLQENRGITMNTINLDEFRSESSRLGYFNLPLDPLISSVKEHVIITYKSRVSQLKIRLSNLTCYIKGLEESEKSYKEKIKDNPLHAENIIGFFVIVSILLAVINLWQNLIFGDIQHQSGIALGFVIACCTLGALYINYHKSITKKKKQLVIGSLVGLSVLLTSIFTLVSTERIFVLKSIIMGLLIGLIVYVFNVILIPFLQGLFATISNIYACVRLALVTKRIRVKKTDVENLNRNLLELDEEIKSVTSLTIREVQLEYELGQIVNDNSFLNQQPLFTEGTYA
jgi:hypothetical protein